MILMNWLFQDELLFEPVAEALATVIAGKNDRYLLLGWCLLLRSLLEYDSSVHQSMLGGEFALFTPACFNSRSYTYSWKSCANVLLFGVINLCVAGIKERYGDLLKILSTCLPDLAGIVRKERYCQF